MTATGKTCGVRIVKRHTYTLGRLDTMFGCRAVIRDDGVIVSHVRSEAGPSVVGTMDQAALLGRFPDIRGDLSEQSIQRRALADSILRRENAALC